MIEFLNFVSDYQWRSQKFLIGEADFAIVFFPGLIG